MYLAATKLTVLIHDSSATDHAMTSGKGKGKRARRTYESAVDTRESVGLLVKQDFDIWQQSGNPFFDKSEEHFLDLPIQEKSASIRV